MQVILDGIERHVAEARLGLDADDGRVDFTVAVAVLAVGLGVVAGRWGGRGLRLGRRHRSDRSGDSGRISPASATHSGLPPPLTDSRERTRTTRAC